jgi:site-specific DNA-methyltransferase (adenine-specific)
MIRRLYCGDNLEVLREQPSRSVHLVYLDPPFNSGRDWYMKSPAGGREQILVFTDKWKWTLGAAQQYKDCTAAGGPLGAALEWFRGILGESGPLAYLAHMAARFSELHRVLGPAAGLFPHVDETMSHYLKILLDQVFGCENFAGQIIWKRTSSHNNVKQGLARVHDVILAYRRDDHATWCDRDGQMILGEHGDVWLDIPPLNGSTRERLGYPTQKPLPLLTRIITLAGGAGDMLLDPYCGCGTSIDAAQMLGLGWIGIDASPDAINLTQSRLRACGADFELHGALTAPPPPGMLF